jgi:cytidyltransferase-like protein
MRRGLVIGKFMPLHRGHQLLIDAALAECDDVTVVVYDSHPPGVYPSMLLATPRLHQLVDATMGDYTWIVCDNDFGWVQDGTRELAGPLSSAFQRRQVDDVGARGVDFVVVSGSVEQQVAQVLARLEPLALVSEQPVRT